MSPACDTSVQPAPPARILIVDDGADNRELLRLILEWEGFVAVTAGSGEEALASAAVQPPDLVLLDLGLPGLGGCEVTVQMKRDVATRHIPIVIISGTDDHATRRRVLGAGAAAFMIKPVGRADLCRRVRGLLGREPEPEGS